MKVHRSESYEKLSYLIRVSPQIAPLAAELATSAWQPAVGAPLSSSSAAKSAEDLRKTMITTAAAAATKVIFCNIAKALYCN